ncbi:hypothetical protein PFISCL1PPCAC_4950, partial [Pristionchus fissidentatus]
HTMKDNRSQVSGNIRKKESQKSSLTKCGILGGMDPNNPFNILAAQSSAASNASLLFVQQATSPLVRTLPAIPTTVSLPTAPSSSVIQSTPPKKDRKYSNENEPGPSRRPGERPSINASQHDVCDYLMSFSISTDIEFSMKALESLHKKLKEKPIELESFIKSVDTKGAEPGGCCLVPRTLDGRLQVFGKKGFPHVIYAKIFRYEETNKIELKSLPICEFGFDKKELDLANLNAHQQPLPPVCVNPYHYQRVPAPDHIASLDVLMSQQNQAKLSPNTYMDTIPSSEGMFTSANIGLDNRRFLSLNQPATSSTQPPIVSAAHLPLLSPTRAAAAAVKQEPPATAAATAPAVDTAAMQQQLQLLRQYYPHAVISHSQAAAQPQPQQPAPLLALQSPDREPTPEPIRPLPEDEQVQWENAMVVAHPLIYQAWKGEERRLLTLDPPRFMQLPTADKMREWYEQNMRELQSRRERGEYNPAKTYVLDENNRGHLDRYFFDKEPSRRRSRPDDAGVKKEEEETDEETDVNPSKRIKTQLSVSDSARSADSPIDVVALDETSVSSASSVAPSLASHHTLPTLSSHHQTDSNLEVERDSSSEPSEHGGENNRNRDAHV